MGACRINYVKMPFKKRATGKRRSRVMRNLHTKRRKQSRGRGRKQSRRRNQSRRRKQSRGRGRKHSRRRKHYVHHHKNVGSAPKLDGYVLRNIILGNMKPSQDILVHMPEMEHLHNLLQNFHRDSEYKFNLPKRKEIYTALLPKSHHKSDEETLEAQKDALTSIIEDLKAMGLKTPPHISVRPLEGREEHKYYNMKTDMMMGLGGKK